MEKDFRFKVWEQWPHYLIACFLTLEDAIKFIKTDGHRFALPIITSK